MIAQCVFKNRFKYDPCRQCSGVAVTCKNYLSEIKYEGHKSRKHYEEHDRKASLSLIRMLNDGGVI
jgi:hypothetical protein